MVKTNNLVVCLKNHLKSQNYPNEHSKSARPDGSSLNARNSFLQAKRFQDQDRNRKQVKNGPEPERRHG